MNLLSILTTLRIALALADLIGQTIKVIQNKSGDENSPDFKPGPERKAAVVSAASNFLDGILLNVSLAPELIAYLKREGISNLVELIYQVWRWTGGKP
jgi:hypothetical protein